MLLTLPSVKHGGGSVVVLGATFEPVVKIKIYGIMNTGKYNQITDPPCNAMWSHLISNSFVFLHNNNLKHKATAVKAYLEKHTTVMDFFPQSSYLNIFEAVWDHPDIERSKTHPTSKQEL